MLCVKSRVTDYFSPEVLPTGQNLLQTDEITRPYSTAQWKLDSRDHLDIYKN